MSFKEKPKRYSCLTFWLSLLLIGRSLAILIYTFFSEEVLRVVPQANSYTLIVMIILHIISIVSIIALFKWKKWGFFVYLTSDLIMTVFIIFIGISVLKTLLSFIVGVAILVFFLKTGVDEAWDHLD